MLPTRNRKKILSSATSLYYIETPVLTCDGRTVCPGDFRNFCCEIRDSTSILAWENDEYIGAHGSWLEFLTIDPVGTVKVREINTGVFANLTHNYDENGVRVLKGELSISDFLHYPDAISIICLNVVLGTENFYGLTVNCM